MKILSFAANEETENAIKTLIESKGFAGRSEVIRKAVLSLAEEEKNSALLKGEIDALILVKHSERHTEGLMEIRHAYQSLVQTHIHTHLKNHECLELFILKGDASKVRKFKEAYETSKKVSQVQLIIS